MCKLKGTFSILGGFLEYMSIFMLNKVGFLFRYLLIFRSKAPFFTFFLTSSLIFFYYWLLQLFLSASLCILCAHNHKYLKPYIWDNYSDALEHQFNKKKSHLNIILLLSEECFFKCSLSLLPLEYWISEINFNKTRFFLIYKN